jgi:4'-phosphopantetheinyl transferase
MSPRRDLWPALPGAARLEEGEVRLFSAWLDETEARRERLGALLSQDERARAGRFRFALHRDRFVAARGLLREILGVLLGEHPSRLAFEYGPRGKPSLAAPFAAEGIRFNLAHADRLAVYAVARNREVGVDVEAVRPLPDAERIAGRFFSCREQAALLSVAAAEREPAFFACWTRKEAFLKATGDGLWRPLDSFDVSFLPSLPARVEGVEGDPSEAGRWSLAELRPAAGYVGAVAFAGRANLSCGAWAREPVHKDLGPRVIGAGRQELEAR